MDSDSYARFAKRDLDKMSWAAPLLNNRFGDLLNIELRHEQLIFIQGDAVLQDIGYSETGKRFSEAEYGKPIRNLEDLKRNGYWLVGRRYDPDVMREALGRQKDGYYYSFFSNQCQDWADRLKRGAERIERERGIAPADRGRLRSRMFTEQRVLPTEPASVWMGLVALALGVGGILAPPLAGDAFTVVLGAFFLASGVSHVLYAFHGKDWSNLTSALLTALLYFVAGGLMMWDIDFARTASAIVIACALGVHGAANVLLGLFSKPRSHWTGKVIAGFVMLAGTAVVAARWPVSGNRALGVVVGASMLAGGLSTIWLSWRTRTSESD